MNAHNLVLNPHCHLKKNAGPLEELIDSCELIVNNDPNYATRPSSRGQLSIIDLALTCPELGQLPVWEIPEKYPSLSDNKLILLGWDKVEHQNSSSSSGTPTGWSIQNCW